METSAPPSSAPSPSTVVEDGPGFRARSTKSQATPIATHHTAITRQTGAGSKLTSARVISGGMNITNNPLSPPGPMRRSAINRQQTANPSAALPTQSGGRRRAPTHSAIMHNRAPGDDTTAAATKRNPNPRSRRPPKLACAGAASRTRAAAARTADHGGGMRVARGAESFSGNVGSPLGFRPAAPDVGDRARSDSLDFYSSGIGICNGSRRREPQPPVAISRARWRMATS